MKKLAFVGLLAGLWLQTGSAAADVGGTNLPFRASGSGTIFESGQSGSLIGSSRGLHLGTGSFSGASFTFSFPPPCGFGTEQGDITLDLGAANGDELYLTIVQGLCQAGATQTYDGTGTYTIDGGTGRFVNATGRGTSSTQAVFPDSSPFGAGTFTYTERGTLSLNTAGS